MSKTKLVGVRVTEIHVINWITKLIILNEVFLGFIMYHGKSLVEICSRLLKKIVLSISYPGSNCYEIYGFKPNYFFWVWNASYIRRSSNPRCLTTSLSLFHRYSILALFWSTFIFWYESCLLKHRDMRFLFYAEFYSYEDAFYWYYFCNLDARSCSIDDCAPS